MVLNEIYLNDWANSFKDKSTPLARRFAEDYLRRFHFAKEEERGFTKIYSITNKNVQNYTWDRPEGAPDIIRIFLEEPLNPGEKVYLNLLYRVKIPSEKFTRYGYDDLGNFKLKYWYITPAVFNGDWKIYSDRNIGDQYTPPADIKIKLSTKPNLYVGSPLNVERVITENGFKTTFLSGDNRVTSQLYLTRTFNFESIEVNSTEVLTNVEDDGLMLGMKGLILNRILKFLELRLGEYPHKTLFVTREDYLNNPVYGLNQLPHYIRPFPDGFQYDIKQLKAVTDHYLKNTLLLNPREEQWVYDAIHISLMMDYVDTYYPDMKLMGNLSDVIGIRWFHAADLEFNDQYPFLYLHMARMNLDQPLTTSQDSLIKFNKNIANAYKAGAGLKYVEDFLGDKTVKASIEEFYSDYLLEPTGAESFKQILQKNADKDISWFFDDYVTTSQKMDFKIKNVRKTEDSLLVTIKNKKNNNMPVPLYGLRDGEIIYKKWVENTAENVTVTIPRDGIERLALNYEGIIPEINQRDNYKGITTFLDKPVQFRLLKDVEDPRYYQLFFMPEVTFNLYDGVAIGPKVYNKPFLNRRFDFRLAPKFGFNSQTLVGSAMVSNTHFYDDENLFALRYGVSGVRFSYGYDLFYEKFTPYLGFFFRNFYLRDNERQSLILRNVNVQQDLDPINPVEQPEYNVFNVSYNYSDTNLVDFITGGVDYELAKNFSKLSMEVEYRKLFKNNQQINLRMFAGTFLYNDEVDNDYFSFALDRPTDYLFDYNYYGRSQSTGLFSQQLITAEGGFKSQLQPEYANQWLTTVNASTNLWKWIFVYGDAGLLKNKGFNPEFVYDSGIRMSLVQDYFEVFFPVYSNLGWEIAQDNYDQKIRFIVTLDLNTLIKLFTREWY
ncbi:metalloprotease [Antarcticibacterium sp. 1MA-6-2]|uniref:metalloprotease n=1 Tax=Antarcticibacterium sp. 1MA-6-2 TaxID=2908210 RepID=UPI001F4561D4|nr:metalloprotease [Antarcticibacterium sp. 1MA-6-2]UJH91264.1 metalloprotease [Antarcticibacterium sp. 1MA-6-2]